MKKINEFIKENKNMVFNEQIITKLFDDKKFQTLLVGLNLRWNDEHEYETIDDYKEVFEKYINNFYDSKDIKIVMRKRPFGFNISCTYLFTAIDSTQINMPARISFGVKKSGKIYWSATPTK